MFLRIFVLALLSICLVVSGGCGGDSDDNDNDSSGRTGGQSADGSPDSGNADVGTGHHDAGGDANDNDPTSDNANAGANDPAGDDHAATGDDPSEQLGHDAHHLVDVQLLSGARSDVQTSSAARSTDSAPLEITFGQIFTAGDVGADQRVVAVAGDKVLATQVDRKATWSDGSLRHGIITVRLTGPVGRQARKLQLYAEAKNAGPGNEHVSLNELLGTNFDARVKITIDGTTYTANARDALTRAEQLGDCPAWGELGCKRWLAGKIASEWIVPAALTHGNDSLPTLRVFFNVRAYRDAGGRIANVRVDSVIENDQAYGASRSNETYDAEIIVGDSRYAVSNITHYTQARWHHVLWRNGKPAVYVRPDIAYLQGSRAVSRYARIAPTDGFLGGVPQSARPMHHVDQTRDMATPGAQAAIGPLPRWTSAFVISGDRRAFNWMLANDDGAGSYGFHYRDGATGRPLKITDHPYVTLAAIHYARKAGSKYQADLLPSCSGNCKTPYSFNIAHQPSIGYVSYLTTGDFYYLEELQFEASYDELWANPRYRRYDKGRLLRAQLQVRGQAWMLRTLSNAAFATPDNDPMKSYFVDQIDYIIQDYLDSYVDDPGHPLHTLDSYSAVHYPADRNNNTEISTWQADFFTWAVGHAAEQDVPGAKRLLDWLAPFQIGLMTSADNGGTKGFCWLQASGYSLKVRDGNESPIYDTLAEVYDKTYPRLAGLPCNSQEMLNALASNGQTRRLGEMSGYPKSPTGFPANFQIGLAAATDSEKGAASRAWKLFAGRPIQPDYSNYANFAVVPRVR